MYDFLIGPMLFFSIAVFMIGILYRVHQFLSFSEKLKTDFFALPKVIKESAKNREKNEYLKLNSVRDVLLKWKIRLKRTIFGKYPIFSVITVIFHVLLLILPLITVGHNILLREYYGVSFPTMPEIVIDQFTILLFMFFLFFLIRRIWVKKVRSISTYRDYFVLFITAAPFITGYMSYHQVFDRETILYIHIICGEFMLIAIPFTKLIHMLFLILSRFLIRNEFTFGCGTRKWV